MTKLSELFGRRDLGSPLERLADGGLKDIAERAAAEIAAAEQDSEIGARLGEENEALRNLLLEAGRKITEIEEFKESFINILDPANRALQALEQEKTANLSFRRTLSQLRSEHEILQTRFFEIEKRSASLEGANAHLRQDYSSVLQTARDYKTSSEELHNELSVERAAKADIDRLFAQLTAQADALGDENQRLRAQGIETESALGKIEAEYSAAKERLAFFESDNQSQQRSLEQTSTEVSRLSQRLSDNESALAAARARVLQLEANLSDVETERNRLTAQLNEISDRTRRESGKLTMQIEAMQTRTVMAEKLLASTRQLLVSRSEEARISDRKALDSKHARDAAEKRVSEVEAWLRAREEQIRDIEQTRSALQERATSQANHLKLRESQLAEIEEKLQSADDRTGQLETEIKVIRMTYERRIEEMNTTLDHARLEQKVAEGALEAARRDRAQLQREISKLRGALRRGVLAEDPSEPSAREPDAQELLRNLDRDINAA